MEDTKALEVSERDHNRYSFFTLENGLRVLLIQDVIEAGQEEGKTDSGDESDDES